jgi:hypothetical protein
LKIEVRAWRMDECTHASLYEPEGEFCGRFLSAEIDGMCGLRRPTDRDRNTKLFVWSSMELLQHIIFSE